VGGLALGLHDVPFQIEITAGFITETQKVGDTQDTRKPELLGMSVQEVPSQVAVEFNPTAIQNAELVHDTPANPAEVILALGEAVQTAPFQFSIRGAVEGAACCPTAMQKSPPTHETPCRTSAVELGLGASTMFQADSASALAADGARTAAPTARNTAEAIAIHGTPLPYRLCEMERSYLTTKGEARSGVGASQYKRDHAGSLHHLEGAAG
jgi:hypothetical protein